MAIHPPLEGGLRLLLLMDLGRFSYSFFLFFQIIVLLSFSFRSETCFPRVCVVWLYSHGYTRFVVVVQPKGGAAREMMSPCLLLVIAYRTEQQQQQAYFWGFGSVAFVGPCYGQQAGIIDILYRGEDVDFSFTLIRTAESLSFSLSLSGVV